MAQVSSKMVRACLEHAGLFLQHDDSVHSTSADLFPLDRLVAGRLTSRRSCASADPASFLGFSTGKECVAGKATAFSASGDVHASHAQRLDQVDHSGIGSHHVSSHEKASSFIFPESPHGVAARRTSYTPLDDINPFILASRAYAAATKVEEDAEYAVVTAEDVKAVASNSITYTYVAITVAMAMGALGVINGFVDLWCADRDLEAADGELEELEKTGWPAYLRQNEGRANAGGQGGRPPTGGAPAQQR